VFFRRDVADEHRARFSSITHYQRDDAPLQDEFTIPANRHGREARNEEIAEVAQVQAPQSESVAFEPFERAW